MLMDAALSFDCLYLLKRKKKKRKTSPKKGDNKLKKRITNSEVIGKYINTKCTPESKWIQVLEKTNVLLRGTRAHSEPPCAWLNECAKLARFRYAPSVHPLQSTAGMIVSVCAVQASAMRTPARHRLDAVEKISTLSRGVLPEPCPPQT